MTGALRLKGQLNKQALVHSLQSIINRHEVLRTVVRQTEGKPYQHILEKDSWQLHVSDGNAYKDDPAALQDHIQQLVKIPFDLSNDHMLRTHLVSLHEQEHVLVVVIHHIAADGWSLSIIIRELVELYGAYVEGREPALPVLPVQYADYALWQRTYLEGEVLDAQLAYWCRKLEDVAPLQLPTDHVRPAVKSVGGSRVIFDIDATLTKQLKDLSRTHEATLYMTLLAAFNVLLYRYTGQEDICVGSPLAGRRRHEIEELVGFFINPVAIRTNLADKPAFTALLEQVKATTLETYQYQDAPFEKIVELVARDRDTSRTPLFQVIFALQNIPDAPSLYLGDIDLSSGPLELTTAKFDLSFFIDEGADTLRVSITYSTDLFERDTMVRMASHFTELLRSVVNAPDQQVAKINMLTSAERTQLLDMFSKATVDYPRNKTIVSLFEEQVRQRPEATALVFEQAQLSYAELNARSNQLANYLRKWNVKEESVVAICIERGLEMMIGILAILKAGAAYVPINPEYPQERISYMLEDTGARVVLSSAACADRIAVKGTDIIELDTHWPLISDEPTALPAIDLMPSHLAYVIYTSGSTGRPKGVMIQHNSLVDYAYGLKQTLNIPQGYSYALVSGINTDLGNTVIYASLLTGGTLHLFSNEAVNDGDFLRYYFRAHSIDCLKIVPGHWKALSAFIPLLPARLLIFGGESLSADVVEMIRQTGTSCRVINHYGPTETTIGKLLHITRPERNYESVIPVGRPFSNTEVYVLSREMELCPVGVPGELYIGGDGLARGYLNNRTLTSLKFVEDPFSPGLAKLLYRTGDLVKYLPDGNIVFLGRADEQVKIRGYRVELGEIENALQASGLVRRCAVIAKDANGEKTLVAYIVPDEGFDKDAITMHLQEKLPEYMIPAMMMEIDKLPLTANGKLDRRNLPEPDMSGQLKDKYVAPRTEEEKKIAGIWQELLEVERIGVTDNFFQLGGHSLLAIRLISALRK
ncbi:MAG TPA: amino acid adenylation domain-containing protein, partial [Chitinophagaceae bacterium]|nr:amino acid adenylation domain-containing protein [Chitinophagaceae bacterium]